MDDDVVTNAILVFKDDKEAGEAVLHNTLCAKTKCHTKDSSASENWRQINAEFFQDGIGDGECDNDFNNHCKESAEGAETLFALGELKFSLMRDFVGGVADDKLHRPASHLVGNQANDKSNENTSPVDMSKPLFDAAGKNRHIHIPIVADWPNLR